MKAEELKIPPSSQARTAFDTDLSKRQIFEDSINLILCPEAKKTILARVTLRALLTIPKDKYSIRDTSGTVIYRIYKEDELGANICNAFQRKTNKKNLSEAEQSYTSGFFITKYKERKETDRDSFITKTHKLVINIDRLDEKRFRILMTLVASEKKFHQLFSEGKTAIAEFTPLLPAAGDGAGMGVGAEISTPPKRKSVRFDELSRT